MATDTALGSVGRGRCAVDMIVEDCALGPTARLIGLVPYGTFLSDEILSLAPEPTLGTHAPVAHCHAGVPLQFALSQDFGWPPFSDLNDVITSFQPMEARFDWSLAKVIDTPP